MGAFSTNDRMDFRAVLSAFADTEVPMPPSGRWGNAGMVRGGTPDVCWRLMDAQYWAEGKHISMDTLARICETLNCEITDVIELVSDEPASTGGKEHERIETKNKRKRN